MREVEINKYIMLNDMLKDYNPGSDFDDKGPHDTSIGYHSDSQEDLPIFKRIRFNNNSLRNPSQHYGKNKGSNIFLKKRKLEERDEDHTSHR